MQFWAPMFPNLWQDFIDSFYFATIQLFEDLFIDGQLIQFCIYQNRKKRIEH